VGGQLRFRVRNGGGVLPVQGSGVVLPAGFAAVGGVLGRGGEVLVRHVQTTSDFTDWWGSPLLPDGLGAAWADGARRGWVDLTGLGAPAADHGPGPAGLTGPAGVLVAGSGWALRLGFRGVAPAEGEWEGLEVAWDPEPSDSPGRVPVPVGQVARLAADGLASRFLALPVAMGWWTDPGEAGRRWWWTACPLGDVRTLAGVCASGAVTVAAAARWGLDLLGAVEWMHSQELVHLDVNPGNVLLAGGRARLADFGTLCATNQGGAQGSIQALINKHASQDRMWDDRVGFQLVGTPGFAAPWLHSTWLASSGYQNAEPWADPSLGLAFRADMWGVLKVVENAVDRAPAALSPDEHALVDALRVWLSGDPVDVPLGADARRDLTRLLRAAAVGTVSELMRRRGRGLPHHTQAGAGAVELGGSLDLFTGRTLERDRLRRHLVDTSPHGSGLLVTAPAGVGKSALLGWLALSGTTPTSLTDTASGGVLTVDVALDAAGASAAELRDRLAAALGVTDAAPASGGSDVLAGRVAERAGLWGRPVVVVIDGVDEAQVEIDPDAAGAGTGLLRPPGVVAGNWIARLAVGCGPEVLRLVVGCRAGSPAGVSLAEAARLDLWAPTLEVAHDSQAAVADLTGYLRRLLSFDDQWAQPVLSEAIRQLTETTAGQIARAAGGNFLVGQLTAMAFRPTLQLGLSVPAHQFPAKVGAAYAQFIQRRFTTRAAERVLELLRPVALTGTVPRYGPHWAGLAAALQPGTPDWTEPMLEDALADPATAGLLDYLVSTNPALDDGQHVRLYHQALADWLLATLPAHLRGGRGNERIARYLHGARPTTGWQDATSWHTAALADHAGRAAVSGRPATASVLLTDLDALTNLAPEAAMAMAGRALGAADLTEPDASIAAAYQECRPRLLLEQSPAQRVAQLQFTVMRNPALHAAADLLKAAVLNGTGPRMVTLWAHPRPCVPGLIGQHAAPVRSLQALEGPDGELLVISGSADGTVRAWTLAGDRWKHAAHDGQPGLIGRHTDPVTAVATLVGATGEPLVVSGGEDGTVRAWTLAGEPWADARYDGQPGLLGRHTDPVTAVATLVGPGGEPQVISGGGDGSVRAWTLDGKPSAQARHDGQLGLLGRHLHPVTALVAVVGPIGEPLVVSGSRSGEVWAWTTTGEPWAGAVHDERPGLILRLSGPLTALASLVGPDGDPLIVSGTWSNSVRAWTLAGEPWADVARHRQPILIPRPSHGPSRPGTTPDWVVDEQPGLIGKQSSVVDKLVTLVGPGGHPVVVGSGTDGDVETWTLAGESSKHAGHGGRPRPIGRDILGVTALTALVGPDGELITVSGSSDGKVRAWTVAGEPWKQTADVGQQDLLRADGGRVASVAALVGPGGESLVVSGGWDGTVRAWSVSGEPWKCAAHDGQPGLLGRRTDPVTAVAALAGPGGEPLVAAGGARGSVRVWTLAGEPWGGARHDDQLGLLGRHSNQDRPWAKPWRVPALLDTFDTAVSSLATLVGPGGEPLVVSASWDGQVRVWTLAGGPWNHASHDGQPGLLGRHTAPVTSVVTLVEPGGELLVVSGGGAEVRAWTLAGEPWGDGTHFRVPGLWDGLPGLLGQHNEVSSVAALVGPGAEPLVISGGDRAVLAWTPAGEPWKGAGHNGQLGLLSATHAAVTSLASLVGPGGVPLVVSGSYDGAVEAWTLGGVCVQALGDVSAVRCLGANSANPMDIAVAFADGSLACLRLIT